jgi:hypothetical protein
VNKKKQKNFVLLGPCRFRASGPKEQTFFAPLFFKKAATFLGPIIFFLTITFADRFFWKVDVTQRKHSS